MLPSAGALSQVAAAFSGSYVSWGCCIWTTLAAGPVEGTCSRSGCCVYHCSIWFASALASPRVARSGEMKSPHRSPRADAEEPRREARTRAPPKAESPPDAAAPREARIVAEDDTPAMAVAPTTAAPQARSHARLPQPLPPRTSEARSSPKSPPSAARADAPRFSSGADSCDISFALVSVFPRPRRTARWASDARVKCARLLQKRAFCSRRPRTA